MNKKRNEKKSPGNGQNEFNKSMFNYLKFSLMKKHLFSFIALLALVLVGGNVMAQVGSGLVPADPRIVVRGSTSSFSITQSGTAAEAITWSVLELTTAEATGFTGTTAAAATDYAFVTSATDATSLSPANQTIAYVKWLAMPASGSLYVVEVVSSYSTPSTCSTRRRFYVNVFDYEVNVYLCNSAGVVTGNPESTILTAAATEGDITTCNSWTNQIIHSSFSGANMTSMYADSIDNTVHNQPKYTDTYFKVMISLSGAPASLDLDDIKWRMRYSIPGIAANLDIYSITNVGAGDTGDGTFSATATATDQNSEISLSTATDYSQNNSILFSALGGSGVATSASYIFQVRTHNTAGQNDAMDWQIRINEVQLETSSSTTFNDGTKVFATGAPANSVALIDGESSIYSINQSPATSPISVTAD